MTYTVSSTDLTNIDFDRSELVKNVLQNIAVILSTPIGTVPLQRDFGLDMSFLGKPENIAMVTGIPKVREAILKWEPRATFVSMKLNRDPVTPGVWRPVITVEIREEGA